MSHIGVSGSAPSYAESGQPLIAQLLSDALKHLPENHDVARARISEAIVLAGGAAEPIFFKGGLAPWQARKINAHVEEHFGGRPTLDEAASLVRVSKSHFSRAFRKTFGRSFSQYVTSYRMEHARLLLATTDIPLSQIALICGLSDQSHLTRLFHRHFGAPPNAWRRAHRTMQAS